MTSQELVARGLADLQALFTTWLLLAAASAALGLCWRLIEGKRK